MIFIVGGDHSPDVIASMLRVFAVTARSRGMVKFDYCPTAASSASGTSSLNEPSVPIPPEVTSLTGITDEMVAGQRFEEAPVSAFVEDAVIGPRCRS